MEDGQYPYDWGEVAEHGRLQLTANELGGHKLSPGFESRPLRHFARGASMLRVVERDPSIRI